MADYIQAVGRLSLQARTVVALPETEIEAALGFLSYSPVAGYPAFIEEEVRLVAAYRAAVTAAGSYDFVWRSIAAGDSEGWIYAVHEAAELQTFADMGVNPFDATQRSLYFEEAHKRATLVELRYLRDWSRDLNLNTSELALEMENPIRGTSHTQAQWIDSLQSEQNWPAPTDVELQEARQFWQHVLRGKTP